MTTSLEIQYLVDSASTQFKACNDTLDALRNLRNSEDDGLSSELLACLSAAQVTLHDTYNKILQLDSNSPKSVVPIMYIYTIYIKSKTIIDSIHINGAYKLDDLFKELVRTLVGTSKGRLDFEIAQKEVLSILESKFNLKPVESTVFELATLPISFN